MIFFGAEVANSYKQVFGRDGRGILTDGSSSLSYYRVKTIWYVFTSPFNCKGCTFLLEVIKCNQQTLNNLKCIQSLTL